MSTPFRYTTREGVGAVIALYVIIGLIAVGILGQQLAGFRRRSARPSIDRYHRAMGALGEMSDHVKVLDGQAASEPSRSVTHEAPPVLPRQPSWSQLHPPAPMLSMPQPRLLDPKLIRSSTDEPATGPPGEGAPPPDAPSKDDSLLRRRRVPALVLLGVVVLGAVLAGVFAMSSAPRPHHPDATSTKRRARRTRPAAPAAISEALPDVVGLDASAAEHRLTAAGLEWRVINVASPKATAAGSVLGERPVAPSRISQGAVVTLSVGKPFVGARVPDVVHPSMSAAAAEAALKAAGFRAKERLMKAATPSEVALQGDVLAASPAVGSVQATHSLVTITVVSGSAAVTIPASVVGESPAQAGATLASAQLVVGAASRSEFAPTVAAGDVAATYPSLPGQSVAVGATVNLVVSIGPPATVPDLRGDTLAQARHALRVAGLVLGSVRSAAGPSGLVVAQAARPGRELRAGTPIAIVIGTDAAGSTATAAVPSNGAAGSSGT